MKDKWMNISYEEDELKPFIEPECDLADQRRIDILIQSGYSRDDIEESLKQRKYDEIMANYLLLGKRMSEVSILMNAFSFRKLILFFCLSERLL